MKKRVMFGVISEFGRMEEYALVEKGKFHEAYQIHCTRNTMMRALMFDGIKGVKSVVARMIDERNENGIFDGAYVSDENARELVKKFAERII